MEIKVLFLDTAAKTGCCIYHKGRIIDVENFRLKKEIEELDLYCKLNEIITKNGITKIVAEDIYNGEKTAFAKLSGYQGIIRLTAQQHSCQVLFLGNLRAKKIIFGIIGKNTDERAMKVSKQAVMNKIKSYGYTPKTEDEADSLMIAVAYLTANGYEINHPAKSH